MHRVSTVTVTHKSANDPQPLDEQEIGQLKAQPALALLSARARAHSAAFQITPGNAADLAAICARLDGLPLAIELAAARLKVLSPGALLERLVAQHALLIHGPADLPERQQTLWATIDWSYQLLDDGAQRLLERLSVFAGGWTLDAAEAACADGNTDPHAVLRDMDALLDNSLIEQAHAAKGDARFRMLATIRAYARDRLESRGADSVREATRAHASYFCELAQRAAQHLRGVDQGRWLESLDDEHANLLAALEASHDLGDAAGFRLAGVLGEYWLLRGMLSEGRRYLERALVLPNAGDDNALADTAQARQAAGQLALMQGDFVSAREHLRAAVGMWRGLNHKHELALALILFSGASGLSGDTAAAVEAHAEAHQLAVSLPDPDALALVHLTYGIDARNQGDYALARRLLHTGLVHFRRQGDAMNLMHALLEGISVALAVESAGAAQARANEALALARQLRNQPALALALNNLGEIARHEGRFDRAAVFYARSLQLWQMLGNTNDTPRVWHNQAYLALHRGQFAQAKSLFGHSLQRFQAQGMSRGVAECVAGLACLAAAQGQPFQAATLWGAAEIAREQNQWGVWPADQADHARGSLQAHAAMPDAAAFERAWQDGRALSLEAAVALLDE